MQKNIKRGFTALPNVVFDEYLPLLSLADLKVLLIVIRQTIGWKKERDWINSRFLEMKTGLSSRSISTAIQDLIDMQLIEVHKSNNEPVHEASERKGKKMLLYSCGDGLGQLNFTSETNSEYTKKKFPITKEKQNNISYKKKNQYKIIEKDGYRFARSLLD